MYDYPLFRPPSEANSLILQITSGCSYNQCSFCTMYKGKKFRIKSDEQIEEHLFMAKKHLPDPEKIFLADGNVLCLSTERILYILELIQRHFPHTSRISSYSGPLDLLRKSEEDLTKIRKAGLAMLYMGVESGSDKVLKRVNKGVNRQELITAGKKAKTAGYILSCMIISGLGGREYLREHAVDSSDVISQINPDYFALLTLMVEADAPLKEMIINGQFTLLSPEEVMVELKLMMENLDLENCVFRANHASNYVNLKGVLNEDKEKFLKQIESALNEGDFKSEKWRSL